MYDELRTTVERAWDDRSLLQDDTTKAAIREVVELIDKGLLRTTSRAASGGSTSGSRRP